MIEGHAPIIEDSNIDSDINSTNNNFEKMRQYHLSRKMLCIAPVTIIALFFRPILRCVKPRQFILSRIGGSISFKKFKIRLIGSKASHNGDGIASILAASIQEGSRHNRRLRRCIKLPGHQTPFVGFHRRRRYYHLGPGSSPMKARGIRNSLASAVHAAVHDKDNLTAKKLRALRPSSIPIHRRLS